MSMMIGRTNSNRARIQIKDPFTGNVIANISYSKSGKTNYASKKKRLNYNFKALSNQILRTKTSFGARQAISAARRKVAQLSRNLNSSEYDDEELKSAIIHAKKMERIARKRMKHLKQEEDIARTGKAAPSGTEMEKFSSDDMEINPEDLLGMSEEELKALMEELEETMKQLESEEYEEYMEAPSDDMADMALEELDSEMDLDRLKKKHRSDELREIVDADMKYLKAMFQRLEREKQATASIKQSSSGGHNFSGNQSASSGVSLEISGSEMPVEAAPAPASAEGGSMDVTI